MKNVNWISTSIRISSSKLTASDITKLLGKKSSRCYKEGELMSPRNPNSKKYEQNLWIYEVDTEQTDDLKSNFDALNVFIKSNEKHFKELLVDCQMDVFCGISYKGEQGGIMLSTETLKTLSSIPIEIVFDLYFEDDIAM